MVVGKISENITKRSVLRLISNNNRSDIKVGAGLGADCAIFTSPQDSDIIVVTLPVTYTIEQSGLVAVNRTANYIAAAGAEPVGITANILLAAEEQEDTLKKIVRQLDATAVSYGMQVMSVQAEVSTAVCHTLVTVTGVGRRNSSELLNPSMVHAGQDIVMTKFIGIEGTVLLASERKKELLQRLPMDFVESAAAMKNSLSVLPEAATAVKSNVRYMYAVSEGGIFAALWNIAERADVGLQVNLKSIPVRQETVEICEICECNPYQLMSTGSLLVITENGQSLVETYAEEKIPAVIIGQITDNNARIVINEDETRYLDLPKPDEIFRCTSLTEDH